MERFHRRLLETVGPEIDAATESLAAGTALDYPAYRQTVGRIQALRDVVAICEQIEKGNEGG